MKIFFRKRKSLRDKCIEAYGEEFGEIYDSLIEKAIEITDKFIEKL